MNWGRTWLGTRLGNYQENLVKSGTWSSRVSNSRGRRTLFTPVGLPYGRILFKFSTTKNGRVITLEVLYERNFTWLYGNMIFMMFRCSPS